MPIGQPNPRFQGYANFGQSTPKQVAVTTSSTVLLAPNLERLYAQVNNNSAHPIWVQNGIAAVVGRGTRVMPGGMLTFPNNELYLGQISAITNGATVQIDVIEGV